MKFLQIKKMQYVKFRVENIQELTEMMAECKEITGFDIVTSVKRVPEKSTGVSMLTS